jgi:hypothetical protein
MPTPLERAPDPGLAWAPIPKERYTSRDFARREWDAMWTRVWLLAGRASDAPAPGDYFTFEIGLESILVENLGNLPRIQLGMRSRGFEALHLGTQEVRILHFHDTLMRYLGAGETGGAISA